ncbi:hypothetical protein M9458_056097, partial [Cirrhinus mrigala]
IPVYWRILSPCIFTKLARDILAPLWEKGIRPQDLNCSSINCLKLLEVLCALRWFLSMLRGRDVLVRTDNIAIVAYITAKVFYSPVACCNSPAISSSGIRRGSNRCVQFTFLGELDRAADTLPRQLPRWSSSSGVDSAKAQVNLFASLLCGRMAQCQLAAPFIMDPCTFSQLFLSGGTIVPLVGPLSGLQGIGKVTY